MRTTSPTVTRAAAAAAVAAGLVFIGVQVAHPTLDATSITTTEMAVRSSLKVLMAALALAGITGMYARQVEETRLVGLVGYVLLAAGYLLILGTSFVAAFVLPTIAATDPAYVNDVLAVATGSATEGDIGLLATVVQVQSACYLVGGLVFGIALYRARVLLRWAAALLALSGVISAALSVMPDALYRFLAWPNGIAMAALGVSLWQTTRVASPREAASLTPAGVA